MSIIEDLQNRKIETEIKFSAVRSSGPGGQNVNKVSSRIELRFNILLSSILTQEEKKKICLKLKNNINSEGELLIFSQEQRSQIQNKKNALEIFYKLLVKALTEIKPRIKTKTPRKVNEERLDEKKLRSQRLKDRKTEID